ncbi:MAG: nucleotidyltransferase family protein [Burkholderiaceae bacterium]|nr:MAG: nucleotidyltransferase family protein [Burkholderiaceae bacterium]
MKTMILAAGRGERMRPLTDACPKPLLPVAGKPLIAWHLERLAAAGLRDIVINHAHLGHMIEEALGDGAQYGVRIAYSDEGTALETAGGIANALPLLGDEPFLVVNGDIFCDFDFTQMPRIAEHLRAQNALAWLLLIPNPPHHPDGDFYLQHHAVTPDAGERLTFSGIGLYQPELFAEIPRGQRAKLAPLLHDAIAAERVLGQRHDGLWVDVGTPERLTELEHTIRTGK